MTFKVQNKPKKEMNDSFAVKKKSILPKRPQYLIEGYRWFDKTYGNTYHTVIITDLNTGEVVHKSPTMVYGYGEQWRDTAYDVLKEKGKVKEEDRFNHALNRKRFIYRQTDVDRKRDLF